MFAHPVIHVYSAKGTNAKDSSQTNYSMKACYLRLSKKRLDKIARSGRFQVNHIYQKRPFRVWQQILDGSFVSITTGGHKTVTSNPCWTHVGADTAHQMGIIEFMAEFGCSTCLTLWYEILVCFFSENGRIV